VADENADRVYVPGAEASPPARDVEPFWADEPETPVHGRAVPLTDRTPPVGMVQVEPGVFRPADGPPLPPGVHVPAQRPTPDGAPAVPRQPHPQSGLPPAPTGHPEGHTAADSPWAQPLHRPAPAAPPAHQGPVGPPVHPEAAGQESVPRPPGEPQVAYPQAGGQQAAQTHPGDRAAFPPPVNPQSPFPPSADQQPAFPSPVNQQPAFPSPVNQQPAFTSPVDQQPGEQRPGEQQPVTRPVSVQPSAGAWSTGHAPGVPPRAQPTPQPPHAAPVTPPTAHAAHADGAQSAAEAWPNAHVAPVPPQAQHAPQPPHAAPVTPAVAPVAQPPHQPQPALPNPHPQDQQTQPNAEADPFQELNWMVDGTPTAEEFARRRLARPAQQSATMGARAVLQKGMFGLVKLAPGQRELEYKQDVEMVRRNFGGLRQVTVVNPKGGAGKTVAVLLLAMTFGQKRGGYVLAWDNNETQGTLGMRAQQDFHARTVRDMMRDLHLFQGAQGRVGDLSQYVRAQGEGMFDVLASDESATAGEMLTASSFAEIRDVVSRFYKLIFVDTGNNVRAENWQAAMDATDQLVITMSARNDSAETAARALDHLEQSGRRRLVRQAVTIVTMPPTRKDIDLQWIQQHFAARTRAVLVAPYERLIDSGEPIRYGELSAGTKDAWLKIAAAVADGL
jgi:MinD-like ATPase involved in chromosome partitioning or flagellar assembly